jgi:hypothetical protein
MSHHDLTSKKISDEEMNSMKEALSRVAANVDRAHALIHSLGLSAFEVSILAQRLLAEVDKE